MANLITRGFGALQRVITRGFYSSAAPSPDCYIGFIGLIGEPVLDSVGFVGRISSNNGFTGLVDATSAGFKGTITGINGFKGDVC